MLHDCVIGQRGPAGADGLNGEVGPRGNTVKLMRSKREQ